MNETLFFFKIVLKDLNGPNSASFNPLRNVFLENYLNVILFLKY